MAGYSKKVKTHFRRLVDEAYERELARELAQLATRFDEWRAGRIKASELSHQVHQFYKGPAHETYNFYRSLQIAYPFSPICLCVADRHVARYDMDRDLGRETAGSPIVGQ
jgi:hypothetical protein